MVELATGSFPYSKWGNPFEQLKQVVNEDPPSLPNGMFSNDFNDFISQWLVTYYFFVKIKKKKLINLKKVNI